MPLTGTVDTANARIDLFVDWVATAGTQTTGSVFRRVGSPVAENEYVRGLFGSALLGQQAYVSDHEAPLDEQIWYVAVNDQTADVLTAGPFTIPSNGYVWVKDPGRPWADQRLDLCLTPSVAAPCPDPPAVTDTFTRTVVDGWGSTETPGAVTAWTNSGGAASDFDVTAGAGTHTHTAVNVIHRSVVAVTPADQSVAVTVAVNKLALTDSFFTGPVARHLDNNNYYWARGTFTPTGTVQLALRKRVAGVETGIGPVVTLLFGYAANQRFRIRLEVVGDFVRARMWPESVAEGDAWDVQAVDTSLTLAGSTGVRSLIGSASTAVLPVVFSFDDFSMSALPVPVTDLVWVGYRDKVRAMDAGLFPVLDRERPADVYARRKDIVTSCQFLSRDLDSINRVYDLFTVGGPLLFQTPEIYGMDKPYGQQDRYFQPGDLNEAYISQDQRKPIRLWTAPLTAVDAPLGLPQGTDDANWCAVKDKYLTYADLTATGLTWGAIAAGGAV